MWNDDWYPPDEFDQPVPRRYRSTPQWRTAAHLGFWLAALPIAIVGAAVVPLLCSGPRAGDWVFYAPILAMGAAIGTCLGALYFAVIGITYRKERHLVMWGTVVQAQISDEDEIRSRYGNSTRLLYQFRDRDDGFEENSRGSLPTMSPFQPGVVDPLMITIRANPTALYDPADPSSNLLYPPKYVECIPPT
jgi:hypothetical protein